MKRSATLFALILSLLAPVPARADGGIHLSTVVIDPGHGGHDPGCVSRDGKTYEKDLTLAISKSLSAKITADCSDVKTILTREDDTYVTLSGRADVANNNNADLFISVHINATGTGTAANGFSVHCLGQSSKKGNDLFSKNLELCKRENSVILLEDDYKTKYQGFDPSDEQSYIFFSLMQSAHLGHSLEFAEDVERSMKGGPIKNSRGVSQDPFWVLWRTTMPAVLIECGFISNPDDLAALRTEEGIDGIAEGIFTAFKTFKKRYDGGGSTASSSQAQPKQESKPEAKPETKPEQKPEAKPEQKPEPKKDDTVKTDGPVYGTQVLAIGKKLKEDDPFFKGEKFFMVEGEKINRYLVGFSTDREEAKKSYARLKKIFPDSFFVKAEGGKTVLDR